jgi:hypothetical protein
MFTLPEAASLPLQVTTCTQTGKLKQEIELKKVATVTVSPLDLALPPGYSKVKDQGELWLDDRTEGVQDLLDTCK